MRARQISWPRAQLSGMFAQPGCSCGLEFSRVCWKGTGCPLRQVSGRSRSPRPSSGADQPGSRTRWTVGRWQGSPNANDDDNRKEVTTMILPVR